MSRTNNNNNMSWTIPEQLVLPSGASAQPIFDILNRTLKAVEKQQEHQSTFITAMAGTLQKASPSDHKEMFQSLMASNEQFVKLFNEHVAYNGKLIKNICNANGARPVEVNGGHPAPTIPPFNHTNMQSPCLWCPHVPSVIHRNNTSEHKMKQAKQRALQANQKKEQECMITEEKKKKKKKEQDKKIQESCLRIWLLSQSTMAR